MHRIVATIILLLSVSTCSFIPQEPTIDFTCPEIGFVNKSDMVTIKDVDLIIDGVSSECIPLGNEEAKTLDLSLVIPFKTYNRLYKETKQEDVKAQYFIAIIGPNEELLQRKVFSTILEFDSMGEGNSEEDHRIDLPVYNLKFAHKYKIIVGFIKQ